ncbi:pentatricopeptide repeat-containing protein At5g16860-like [Gossypium hirsutum]|uniref:Pentatricopeptide repeat-containing protein At5g16860-like n=1 Tax=Gossypium hirsutum TaxID=3635 RepID=A0ABM2YHK6_GOSHI|nr:pentatricopeptide repeat-containing protein At5g16860-like [Gossypium hirsutum]
MPERTLISWTILMSGYAKHGPSAEALALFKEMLSSGDNHKTRLRPDSYVYAVVLRSCGEMRELGFGKGVHGQVLKKGEAFLDGFLENSLVNMYSSCGQLEDAVLILTGLRSLGIKLDAFVFSMVIKACSNLEELNLGIQVHGLMVKKGFEKGSSLRSFRVLMHDICYCDDFTITSILKAISSLHDMGYGRQVHGYIVRTGFVSNSYVMCSLLDMYIECIEHESWEQWEKVPLKVYAGLERGEANECIIIASMLKWCSLLSNLDAGKVFHSLASKLAVDSDPYVISALIDMYSKCGVPDAA